MASNNDPLHKLNEFLIIIRLERFKDPIIGEGVQTVEELQDIPDNELKEMGMSRTEIQRFKRMVQEEINPVPLITEKQDTEFPFTPVSVNPEITKKLIIQRSNRSNLRISYQLMTELKPQINHLSKPFDSENMHYFDLVNMICEQENRKLGNKLTIELYTREGYPLAINPSSYISKLSDWCLETYDPILLYAIPRPKIFTEKDEKYLKNIDKVTGIKEVIYILSDGDELNFGPIPVGVNCKEVKINELKKYFYDMTSLPPSCFRFKFGKIELKDGNNSLKEYGIKDQSFIYIIPDHGFCISTWEQNFSAGACLATWDDSQTGYGMSMFFASLYAISEWVINTSLHNTDKNILGHIRSITGCAPLIHALKLLFNKECLTLPHRVAIQEVLMLVFKLIGPKELKGDVNCSTTIQEKQILEESINFWAYFIEFAKEYHSRTEEYSNFNLCCSIKNNRMRDPKRVMDSQRIPHVVDRQNYSDENNTVFEPLPEFVRIIKSFSCFEAQIWNVKDMVVTEVDLTRDWATIKSKMSKMPFLRIQRPLALKDSDTCPVPCMILGENGMVCNYIGPSKNPVKSYEGFDPLDGYTFNFDADDLNQKLKKSNFLQFRQLLKDDIAINPNVDIATITRPLKEIEELIMVVLDNSRSMAKKYFANKSRYELAITGFEQFCNRTTAYNYKNMIGLVIFGGTSKLELELTESFRHFSEQIKSYPYIAGSAIYDAIVYTINYLTSFKSKRDLPNNIQTRILCLTDGEDNGSKTSPDNTSKALIRNNIVMDSILFRKEKIKNHAIAKKSGGLSFQPTTQNELLKIFEFETMLNLACRKYKDHLDSSIEQALLIPFDTNPEFRHPDKLASIFQTSQKCLANAIMHKTVSSQVSPEVTKRILKELAYLQTNPHTDFEIFPCSDAIDFWHLMLEAPKGTPYEDGIFCLYIEFTKDYPNKAPNIRFITPIYHCNINSAGRICHKVLDRFYSPEKKIRELLDHVYGLLLEATPDDPLDSYKAALLSSNKQEYEKEARKFTQTHARHKTKRDVRIEILGGNPDVWKNYPAQFVCPLSLNLYKEPVMTRYGETYEKGEIEEYLDNVAEQDPFSFKSLHKYQLFPNNNIKRGVDEFRSELHNI